jgi:ABC-type transporter Mla MlaB component
MPIAVYSGAEGVTLKLAGEISIRQAKDLGVEISAALPGVSRVHVDTSEFADADTSILQILCSLRKTVPALSFDNSSEAFIAAVDRCGLRRELLGTLRESES